jgi:uroporphyrinogen decarboxylase
VEGYFGERYKYVEFEAGRYLEACHLPFAGVDSLEDLDRSHFPKPDWFDYSTIREQAKALREQGFAVCCGTAGDMDFINGISRARGMEQVLMDLIDDDPVYLEIMQARFEFFYEMQRRTLEAAGGLIDFAHAGEDFGNQRGPMISLDIFERRFAPKYGKYFEMVHSHNARTMLHMCGCCEAFLPRLIELGLDIYDVVQPTTPSMDIAVLNERFGDRLAFCGSICVQTTLAWGAPQDVEREVRRRIELFPEGGLFLGPTHAVQVGSPLENVLAMYRAAGSLREEIDESILSIEGGGQPGEINLSKLF